LVLALGGNASFGRALATGGVAGLAVLVRPNLAPLSAVIGLTLVWRRDIDWRRGGTMAAAFGAGLAPGVGTVALLQTAMYGGPLTSGYGRLSNLFNLAHVPPNAARYARWLIETETPFAALALAAPWMAADATVRRQIYCLIALVAAAFGCYL